jgi:hypothetical protein
VRAALSQEREKKEGRGGGFALERKEEKWSEKKKTEGMKGVLPELGRIMLHLKLVLVALVVDLDRPFSGT